MTGSHQYITQHADGRLIVHVPKNERVEQPLRISIERRPEEPLVEYRNIEILVETGAKAIVLLNDRIKEADESTQTFQNIKIEVGENSHLDVYEVEETHVSHHRESNIMVTQQAFSSVTLLSLTLQAGQTQNHTVVHLNGKGAETYLLGGVIADGQQKVENHTLIDHAVPECSSNELYKYVLDEDAVGVFEGRILVQKDAQKSSSQETNANLVSAKTARMFTQPALEIYADDVKCNHGATIGQLDEQAMFYMQQRGIPYSEARMLLKFAFIEEVIDHLPLEGYAEHLRHLIEKRICGELPYCGDCKLCK
ncbi:MAG: SufD family Fe-S cluster assembly protein [Bacteroidaceae bacterium]|nr:SufD family Fe-S cluster assembly protein [Bacteroidaceae bacterium]MCF0185586.1 SufD family Fe-S cluster assembly protein [Bacteroidaceae bacterium]